MNLFKKILVAACFGIIGLGGSGQSWGADWIFYYQTELEDESKTILEKYYYDKSSVERPQKNIIKLTQKITILVNNAEETDKKVVQIEMNCSSYKYRVLSQTEFDGATGKAMAEGQVENLSWKRFAMESSMGGIRDNLCFEKKQQKEPEKKPEKKQKDKEPDKQKDNGPVK